MMMKISFKKIDIPMLNVYGMNDQFVKNEKVKK